MFNGTATYIGNLNRPTPARRTPLDLTINQTFPKGMALAQWLAGPVVDGEHDARASITVAGSRALGDVGEPADDRVDLPA